MDRYEYERRIGLGEDFQAGRMYVINHLDDFDISYWYGILNALRSQNIKESKKLAKASRMVEAYLRNLK